MNVQNIHIVTFFNMSIKIPHRQKQLKGEEENASLHVQIQIFWNTTYYMHGLCTHSCSIKNIDSCMYCGVSWGIKLSRIHFLNWSEQNERLLIHHGICWNDLEKHNWCSTHQLPSAYSFLRVEGVFKVRLTRLKHQGGLVNLIQIRVTCYIQ